MLQVKSVIILKAKPGILKCGGGIKMWMWLCVERGSYLGFGNSLNEEDMKKYCETKKEAKRVVYLAMYQKAWEAEEQVNLCRVGHELFRITKQRAGEKRDVVGVSCFKDETGAMKVSLDDGKKI